MANQKQSRNTSNTQQRAAATGDDKVAQGEQQVVNGVTSVATVHEKLRQLGIDYSRPIKSVEFHPDGNVARIEFDNWPAQPVAEPTRFMRLIPFRKRMTLESRPLFPQSTSRNAAPTQLKEPPKPVAK